ncbi:hypothetical protein BJI67_13790 [Acidihalobacter aeolianus]|uniref:Lipid/polyisoprenoid-binding YceI-like domain-containing protein n=1 Tax=Acidihalobacter aeolianus TaxID=2792603 RepID=A0A1D8KAJ4_9GAMM|nr:YceI family protein [Acidihalobacter aeolianus]AOV17988.1 hypothetical protein BJI67_13790 [Acidihalobacter aeolianus]
MRNKLLNTLGAGALALGALNLVPSAAQAAPATLHDSFAGTYKIDHDHSLAWFTVEHARVSEFVGRFDKIAGTYTFDPKDPAKDKVEVTIPVDSLDTNFAMRNRDLLGPDFFNAREFPDIKFVSTRYEPTGKHTGKLYGNMTLHGTTHPIVFRVRQIGAGPVNALPKPWGGYLSGYVATATIKRSDFGVSAYEGMIGNRVRLHINIEGVRTGHS